MGWFRKKTKKQIEFEEVFFDANTTSSFDRARMEGTLELPLSHVSIIGVGVVFALIAFVFSVQVFRLQVVEGNTYRAQSENNRLDQTLIIAERGVIYDRRGERIAWNEDESESIDFPERAYTDREGFGQLVGFVSYPQKDAAGFYYRTEYLGRNGIEEAYNEFLAGENGEQLVEVGATGEVISEHVVRLPVAGGSLNTSLDAELSEVMHDVIATTTAQRGFRSGAGAIMDVHTGEVIALTSFPSFDPEVMADGSDARAIEALGSDERFPFLNKVVHGVYTPGSIVKPFLAFAALKEDIIDPKTEIVSTGRMVIPNPYNPGTPSVFADWRAHGAVDMRQAIAVSSNIYFYHIGGGFEEQEGLGITKINEYMRMFGFGEKTGVALSGEQEGTVPNPEWKEEVFDDDWRLGDTYLTAIGQFGFQSTPLQVLRAYAAIANGGTLVTPHFEKGGQGDTESLALDQTLLRIVQEGMRQSVLDGTARSLNRRDVEFAGKTGTAELDARKLFVNSWVVGYVPYEEPKYVFVLLMEHGPRENLFGAAPTMRGVLDWMAEHRPEYLGISEDNSE